MKFSTLPKFKEVVRDYTINIGREIKWVKNESYKAKAPCKVKVCPWTIYYSRNEI
jgi:hypothetical protein